MPWLLHRADSPMPEYGGGHPVHQEHWKPGEKREVTNEASEYLLTVFEGYFESSSAPGAPVGEAVAKPQVDRAMKPPAKKKAAPKKKATKK